MPPTSGDAPVSGIPDDWIPALAELYDKFAHSLEPFSEERDNGETVFISEVSHWWDLLDHPKPTLQEFRKRVIVRCKRYLAAKDKPQDKKFLRNLDDDQYGEPPP
jgi:hypothetical protein